MLQEQTLLSWGPRGPMACHPDPLGTARLQPRPPIAHQTFGGSLCRFGCWWVETDSSGRPAPSASPFLCVTRPGGGRSRWGLCGSPPRSFLRSPSPPGARAPGQEAPSPSSPGLQAPPLPTPAPHQDFIVLCPGAHPSIWTRVALRGGPAGGAVGWPWSPTTVCGRHRPGTLRGQVSQGNGTRGMSKTSLSPLCRWGH